MEAFSDEKERRLIWKKFLPFPHNTGPTRVFVVASVTIILCVIIHRTLRIWLFPLNSEFPLSIVVPYLFYALGFFNLIKLAQIADQQRREYSAHGPNGNFAETWERLVFFCVRGAWTMDSEVYIPRLKTPLTMRRFIRMQLEQMPPVKEYTLEEPILFDETLKLPPQMFYLLSVVQQIARDVNRLQGRGVKQ